MKRVLAILVLVFVFAFSAEAQIKTEMMLGFSSEIDSVIIRAAKSGTKKMELIITPYSGKQIITKDFKSGDLIPITWEQEIASDSTGPYGEEKITIRFLNDSVFEQINNGNAVYGLIHGNEIYEYNLVRKKVKEIGKKTVRDSLGYRIVEWNLNPDLKERNRHTIEFYNSSGQKIRTYSKSYAGEFLTIYDYLNDSVWSYRNYQLNVPDTFKTKTITYVSMKFAHDWTDTISFANAGYTNEEIQEQVVLRLKNITSHRDTTYYRQSTSPTVLSQEFRFKKVINAERTQQTFSYVTTTYDVYSGKVTYNDKSSSETQFKYDQSNRLVYVEEISKYSSGYWKNVMKITYYD